MPESRQSMVRLRSDVRLIPMVNSWYTTALLLSPMTFGLVTKRSHLPMMESYVDAPEIHRQCVNAPELRGGPFIDHAGDPADVGCLLEVTRVLAEEALRTADAIESAFRLVHQTATGNALRSLYERLPSELLDAVELHYDAYKQPGLRFIESAMYRAFPSLRELQSCRLEVASKEPRPFFLSTPLLARRSGSVDIRLPFAAPVWDVLFGRASAPLDNLTEAVEPHLINPERDLPHLLSLLAPADSGMPAPLPVEPGRVRVRYFGHACVLMECAQASVLIDPLVSYPNESDLDRFTFDDLPARIDYVLLTHAHVDHFVLETLLQIRHKVGCVVVGRAGGSVQDVSLKLALNHCGFQRVMELGEHDEFAFPGGRIVGAPFYGEHADLDIRAKLVFGVTLEDATCAFFADSNPPSPECYRHLRNMLPRINCLFLGMECVGAPATWTYGPLLQRVLTREEDQSRRLDGSNSRTAGLLQDLLDPEFLFVYAMGAEPWVTHLSSIVYSEALPQFQEARLFERQSRAKGKHAQVLFGKMEWMR